VCVLGKRAMRGALTILKLSQCVLLVRLVFVCSAFDLDVIDRNDVADGAFVGRTLSGFITADDAKPVSPTQPFCVGPMASDAAVYY